MFPWVIPSSIIITSLCWADAQSPECSELYNVSHALHVQDQSHWLISCLALEYSWCGCFPHVYLPVSLYVYLCVSLLPLLSPAGLYSSPGQSGQWAARQSGRAWSPPFWNNSRWVGIVTAPLCKEVNKWGGLVLGMLNHLFTAVPNTMLILGLN